MDEVVGSQRDAESPLMVSMDNLKTSEVVGNNDLLVATHSVLGV